MELKYYVIHLNCIYVIHNPILNLKPIVMRKILFILSLCILQQVVYAQSTLKGLVKAENGEALGGVSVINENQNTSTLTNPNGEFAISAKIGDILKF